MNSREEQTLAVTEIFKSIQGESTRAGLPCIFVRLTGCPLRCRYCDTTYAYAEGAPMTIGQIVERCEAMGGPLVEITGGEPLAQEACTDLAAALLDRGKTVLVETSGALPIDVLPEDAIRIMDVKCPGSGMADRMRWENVDALTNRDEVKFVVGDREDYEWSRNILAAYDLSERCRAVLFAPVFGRLDPRTLAEWMLADGLEARLQLQLHKYIWPPNQRGV